MPSEPQYVVKVNGRLTGKGVVTGVWDSLVTTIRNAADRGGIVVVERLQDGPAGGDQ